MKTLLERVLSPITKVRRALALAPLTNDLHEAWQEREAQPLNTNERELLENALTFGAAVAEDIFVPRGAIAAVPFGADFNQVMDVFRDSYHSRLLVYGDDLDDVRGMVMLKDMTAFFASPHGFDMAAVLRPVAHVPETMALPKILQQMKRQKCPLVVVHDEFGGTSGLLVLRDILEQLVGDMNDDERDDELEIIEKNAGVYVMGAGVSLEDAAGRMKLPLDEWAGEEIGTVGGWVALKAQRIPQRGEVIALGHGLKAVVVQATAKQLQRVELHVVG